MPKFKVMIAVGGPKLWELWRENADGSFSHLGFFDTREEANAAIP